MAQFISRELPFGRFGRPRKSARSSPSSPPRALRWVSGACITVDGCQSKSNI